MNAGFETMEPFQPGLYEHFKGNRYLAIGLVVHSETQELFVLYEPLQGDGRQWIRPLAMWSELVNDRPRFRYLGPAPGVEP